MMRWLTPIAVLCVPLFLSSASGQLLVDFDDNDAGIDTQLGYTSVTTAGGSVAAFFGQGGTIDVSFSAASIDDRNRGPMDVSQPLGDIGRDFIFGNAGGGATFLDVNLGDLAAGNYTITTYHHDNDGSTTLDIDLDVDTGGGFVDGTTLTSSIGTNPAGGVASGTFSFDANGVDPVTLRTIANTNGHIINGFTLTANPEDSLRVDIGTDGQDVQAGFFSLERPTAAGSDDETQRFLTTLGNSSTVDVTLNTADVFRDRGDVAHPLGDLAETFFARQDELTLTLSDLAAGEYEITTYHHDATVDHDVIGVLLTDAENVLEDLGLTVDQTTGLSPTDLASLSFTFEADGINDVEITFFEVNNLGTPSIVLNGFELNAITTAVPEPASIAVWSLLGMTLVGLGLVRLRLQRKK